MAHPKVTVFLSSFNGERYIEEQIKSIELQQNVDVSIVIRDDGSSDGTISILERLSRQHNNILIIRGSNLGYANSFLSAMKYGNQSDYFAFSDQDDVWEKDKLDRAICFIGETGGLYASALQVVDESLKKIEKKDFSNYRSTIGGILSRSRLSGCTMVFDKEIYCTICKYIDKIISFNTFNYGHDGWILLISKLLNKQIQIDSETRILYRRHNSTVTNVHAGIKKRLRNEWKIFWNKEKKREKIAGFLLNTFRIMPDECKTTLEAIWVYKKQINKRILLLRSDLIRTGVKIIDIKNAVAVLVGRY